MENQPHANPARRQVLKGVGVLGGLAVAGGLGWTAMRNPDTTDQTPTPDPAAETELEVLARSAVAGGPISWPTAADAVRDGLIGYALLVAEKSD